MLDFRGHSVTKSRGYSTALGVARRVRRLSRRPKTNRRPTPTTDSKAVLSVWQYVVGSGYLNPSDALLAARVEASLPTTVGGSVVALRDGDRITRDR